MSKQTPAKYIESYGNVNFVVDLVQLKDGSFCVTTEILKPVKSIDFADPIQDLDAAEIFFEHEVTRLTRLYSYSPAEPSVFGEDYLTLVLGLSLFLFVLTYITFSVI